MLRFYRGIGWAAYYPHGSFAIETGGTGGAEASAKEWAEWTDSSAA